MTIDRTLQPSLFDMGGMRRSFESGSSMFTDLIQRMKSLIRFSSLESPSITSLQASSASDVHLARSLTHVITRESSNTAGLMPMAIISGLYMVTGSLFAKQAYGRYQRAGHLQWQQEEAHAAVDMTRGALQVASGGMVFSSRFVASIKELLKREHFSLKHGSLVMISQGLHVTSNAVAGVLQLVSAFSNSFSLRRVRSFSNKINKIKGLLPEQSLEHLQKITDFVAKRIKTSPYSTLQKLTKKYAGCEEKLKSYLRERGVKAAISCIADASLEHKLTISKSEIKDLASILISKMEKGDFCSFMKHHLGFKEADETIANRLSAIELWGLAMESESRSVKKELKFSSSTSGIALSQAKSLLSDDLQKRLSSKDPFIASVAIKEAKELTEKIFQDLRIHQGLHTSRIIIYLLSFISNMIAIVFTAGASAIAAASLSLSLNVLSNTADLTIVHRNLNDKTSIGKYDKLLIKSTFALTACTLIASIALISALSLGTVPLALVIITGIFSLITTAIIYRKMSAKQKLMERENPTINYIKKKVLSMPSEEVDEKIRPLIKRLPKSQRKDLKCQLTSLSGIAMTQEKELSSQDKLLDNEHTFGERIFQQDPLDKTVLKACKKLWRISKSQIVRGLYERLLAQNISEIQSYLATKMSLEEKTALFSSIYEARAKNTASWHFQLPLSSAPLLTVLSSMEKEALSKKI